MRVALLLLLAGCEARHSDTWEPLSHQCAEPVVAPWPYFMEDSLGPLQANLPVLGPAPEPFHPHLGFRSDPAHDATFTWRTDLGTLATEVELTTPEGTVLLEGASFLTPDATSRIHVVHACDLEPDTTYTWRGGGTGAWSEPAPFTTAPASGDATVRVAVVGDSRDDMDTWRSILRAAWSHEPALVVHTGDMVHFGTMLSEWDPWFDATESILAQVVLVPVHGNHEYLAHNFHALFTMPHEYWYGFDWGPLHFAVADDMLPEDLDEEQTAWLPGDLAATDRAWRVGLWHQPAWSASNHGSNESNRELLATPFEAYPGSLVISGHNHLYERTVPIRGGEAHEDGTTFLTTGGAGAPLYSTGDGWFVEVAESSYHYVVLDVSPTRLELTAFQLDGTVFDQHVIER